MSNTGYIIGGVALLAIVGLYLYTTHQPAPRAVADTTQTRSDFQSGADAFTAAIGFAGRLFGSTNTATTPDTGDVHLDLESARTVDSAAAYASGNPYAGFALDQSN